MQVVYLEDAPWTCWWVSRRGNQTNCLFEQLWLMPGQARERIVLTPWRSIQRFVRGIKAGTSVCPVCAHSLESKVCSKQYSENRGGCWQAVHREDTSNIYDRRESILEEETFIWLLNYLLERSLKTLLKIPGYPARTEMEAVVLIWTFLISSMMFKDLLYEYLLEKSVLSGFGKVQVSCKFTDVFIQTECLKGDKCTWLLP